MSKLKAEKLIKNVYGNDYIDYLKEERPDIEEVFDLMDSYGEYLERKNKNLKTKK